MRTKLPQKGDEKKLQLTRAMIELAAMDMGLAYNISQKELTTKCVFHEDGSKPSLYINVDEKPGVYHCFAASCGVTGVFTEFVQQVTGWTFVKTLQYCIGLRKRTMMRHVDEGADLSLAIPSATQSADEIELEKYDFTHPYCIERGLTEQTLHRFRVGYDKKLDRITFPWFDRNGVLITIKRRSPIEKFYSYPKGADLTKTLYGLQLVKQHAIVWLVEGEFDAMTLDQVFRLAHLDRHFAVALGGSALLPSQIEALMKKQPDLIVLMLDNDEGGAQAVKTARRIVASYVKYVEAKYPRPDAKDPNALTFDEILTIATTVESHIRPTTRESEIN